MLKLADYQRKRQNKHFLINIIYLTKVYMHSKIISMHTSVHTGTHREDHWFKVLQNFRLTNLLKKRI